MCIDHFVCDIDLKNDVVYVATQGLMEKLALEAMEVAMVSASLFIICTIYVYVKTIDVCESEFTISMLL